MKFIYLFLSFFILHSLSYAQTPPFPIAGEMHCTDYKWYRGNNGWYPIGSFDLEFLLAPVDGVLTYQHTHKNFQGYEHSSSYPRIPGPWKVDGQYHPSDYRGCAKHRVETYNGGLKQVAYCGGVFSLTLSFNPNEINIRVTEGNSGGGQYDRQYWTVCRSSGLSRQNVSSF